MDLIKNLKIRTKLNILVIFASLLMVAIGTTGLLGINISNSALSSVYHEKLLYIIQLNEVREQQMQVRTELLEAGLERDAFEILGRIDKVRSSMFKIETILGEYSKHAMSADEKKMVDAFMAGRLDYGRNGVLPIMELLQAEKFEQVQKLRKDIMNPGYAKASEGIDALIQLQVEAAKEEFERVENTTRIIRITAIASIIIGLTLSIALGLIITRSVNYGVRELAKTASKLANGELAARVDWDSTDELGDVGRAFNQMATEFSSLISQVRQSADQVATAAAIQTGTADKVSTISENQTQQAAIAASSIENLNLAVRQIAQKTVDVLTSASDASAMADEGQLVVNKAVVGIQQVAVTVRESAVLMASLGQRSDQIGQIINVIKDIAEQTNLLALNAAIEAARAGEQGRGFAVVADEVRKLAERTAMATSEISKMISAIQSETGNAVATMEKGSSEVSEGVALANQAGKSLQNINSSVKRVVDMIEQISESTRSQSETTNEITQRVEHIAEMAQENTVSVDATTHASHDLQELSSHLQQVVSRFKL
ncbi:MAG TPA: methyl-accepting chemotaxis protein [Gallionellaceae bacterium]|nr:methyl-accepting chemotaxis protein [Gallionellaceae bacterium]